MDSIERGPLGPDDRISHGPDRPRTDPGEEGPPSDRTPNGEREGRTLAPNCTMPFGARPCISLRQVAYTLHLGETEQQLGLTQPRLRRTTPEGEGRVKACTLEIE